MLHIRRSIFQSYRRLRNNKRKCKKHTDIINTKQLTSNINDKNTKVNDENETLNTPFGGIMGERDENVIRIYY